jgi:geranylgeranyl diphosphate synthase type I
MSLLTNEQVKSRVDSYLLEFFDRKTRDSRIYGQSYQELLTYMKEFVLRGGKRLRPYLVYLSYCAASESETPPQIQAMAAVELFHVALLIHDDIIDQDDYRYGGPNIIGRYNGRGGRHIAESIALLAGDIALAMVLELLAESSAAPEVNSRIIQTLAGQFQEVLAGQFLDSVPGANSFKRLENVLLIHQHKTASYTTIGPLQIGLTLLGATTQLEQPMRRYGQALGMLFGLTDDLLGMFGDVSISGKPACSDLHEAKPTVLFFYAKELLTGGDREAFTSLLGQPHKDGEDLVQLRAVLTSSGAKARTEAMAEGYADEAAAALVGLQGPPISALQGLLKELLDRKW